MRQDFDDRLVVLRAFAEHVAEDLIELAEENAFAMETQSLDVLVGRKTGVDLLKVLSSV